MLQVHSRLASLPSLVRRISGHYVSVGYSLLRDGHFDHRSINKSWSIFQLDTSSLPPGSFICRSRVIRCFLSRDHESCFHKVVLFGERAAELRQRNILQLPDTLARNTETYADLLQSFGLSTVETETLRNNFLFAVVENFEQPIHFVAQIFVAQQFEWSLRLLVADQLAELRRIIVANRGVERSGSHSHTF